MRFRYSLSTLLLLCIALGSAIGLWINRNAWQKVCDIKESFASNELYNALDAKYPCWIYKVSQYVEFWKYPKQISTKETCAVNECLYQNESTMSILICQCNERGNDIVIKEIIPFEGKGVFSEFSPDKSFLILSTAEHTTVYRRGREYGYVAFLRLPLFWIFALSMVSLLLTNVAGKVKSIRK